VSVPTPMHSMLEEPHEVTEGTELKVPPRLFHPEDQEEPLRDLYCKALLESSWKMLSWFELRVTAAIAAALSAEPIVISSSNLTIRVCM